MKHFFTILTLLATISTAHPANANVILNEILADPPAGAAGDANNDGVTSSSADEFVELLNFSHETVNLSGWSITDAVRTRHVFPNNTFLSGNRYLVIFGNGDPVLPDVDWQTASSGSLGLNNTGDTISFLDRNDVLMAQYVYGSEANHNQSLTQWPEGSGDFVLHASLIEAEGRLFSPGKGVDGSLTGPLVKIPDDPINSSAVPEPGTVMTLSMGLVFLMKRKQGTRN